MSNPIDAAVQTAHGILNLQKLLATSEKDLRDTKAQFEAKDNYIFSLNKKVEELDCKVRVERDRANATAEKSQSVYMHNKALALDIEDIRKLLEHETQDKARFLAERNEAERLAFNRQEHLDGLTDEFKTLSARHQPLQLEVANLKEVNRTLEATKWKLVEELNEHKVKLAAQVECTNSVVLNSTDYREGSEALIKDLREKLRAAALNNDKLQATIGMQATSLRELNEACSNLKTQNRNLLKAADEYRSGQLNLREQIAAQAIVTNILAKERNEAVENTHRLQKTLDAIQSACKS